MKIIVGNILTLVCSPIQKHLSSRRSFSTRHPTSWPAPWGSGFERSASPSPTGLWCSKRGGKNRMWRKKDFWLLFTGYGRNFSLLMERQMGFSIQKWTQHSSNLGWFYSSTVSMKSYLCLVSHCETINLTVTRIFNLKLTTLPTTAMQTLELQDK